MKIIRFFSVCLCLLALTSCDLSGITGGGDNNGVDGGEEVNSTIDLTLFENCKELRFSSYLSGTESSTTHYLKQVVPYDDNYKVKTNKYTNVDLYDEQGKLIVSLGANDFKRIDLKERDIIYTVAKGKDNCDLGFEVELDEHKSLLPYDPINLLDTNEFLSTDKSTYDPLVECHVEYIKREGGMYINCNNPEKLTDTSLNKALTRNDVSNKEVFFTFEHNNNITGSFHYGYQVINKGTEDVYVTVKNIGFQLDGAGCWLGEQEWTDFYNTEFRMKNYDSYTPSQLQTLEAYYSFCNSYKSPDNQPITYRIPAGKHIYVMGGTTEDAYNNINVFNTADMKVSGGCSNGAVLFEVIGDNVEGAFYAYKKYENVSIENTTHQGYVAVGSDGHEYGRQYVGYDNCHGVVDANLVWEFSDLTAPQQLPVYYVNYYKSGISGSGNKPYSKIDSTAHENHRTDWVTHINPQNSNAGVGTDMTKYYTIDSNGNSIVIDSDHIDGLGYTANIGNWMIDYMENYTLVNHGSKDRKVTVSFTNTGSVAVLVRDENGNYIDGTAQYTICSAANSYGAALYDRFSYTVVIPAKSVVQFTVEYNLLANSSGYIQHKAVLE